MQPRYPIFIPSRGRAKSSLTAKAFDKIKVRYKVIVEEDERDIYEKTLGKEKVLAMPYHGNGVVETRNWIWDYAETLGVHKYWSYDDNIKAFYRFNKNLKVPVSSGAILCAIEDFTERYINVPIAGMNYFMFASRKEGGIKPFTLNTRIYSNMLLETKASNPKRKKYRFEGFYNEDTDLCLRVLKDGFCTLLFNAFLIEKSTTMTVKGGNTPNYKDDGRWLMAEELRRKHPDVTKTTRKWGRWQHHVNYKPFRGNKLLKKKGVHIPKKENNYGMTLRAKR